MSAVPDPERKRVTLHFWVRMDLVIGGRMQSTANYQGLSLNPEAPPMPNLAITRFLLAAWVGGGNVDFCVEQIDASGVARVRLTVFEKDVDTVKFSVSFNIVAPKGQRNCHLASSALPVEDLGAVLRSGPSAGPKGGAVFSDAQRCFSMRDNFTKNTVVLRFQNIDTNCDALLSLPLRESALRSLCVTNAAVMGLGKKLQSTIARYAVSPLNAGPQYMEAFSYLQLQSCLIHYSIIGYAFDRLTSPVQLPWLMYDAYQAVHCSGIHPAALGSLPAVDFVLRFGQPLVTAHTACGLSSVYCTDYTLNAEGVASKLRETEDMAKTYGALSLQSQSGLENGSRGPVRSYSPPPSAQQVGSRLALDPVASVFGRCVALIKEAQRSRRERGLASRLSYAVLCDDCENAAQSIIQKAKGLRDLFRLVVSGIRGAAGLSAPVGSAGDPAVDYLADAMGRVAATAPWSSLFGGLKREDHLLVAGAMLRLGGMLHSGEWATAFAVVSAKGPSYTEESPTAPGALSGHGTVVSRVRSKGQVFHGPLEGTTCLCQDPPLPAGVSGRFCTHLEDGTLTGFDYSEFATVFGQNVHRTVGISVDACVAAHLKASYGDKPQQCPFYVSAFYTGLSEGPNGSMGCVPLDTKPPANFGLGSQTLFGAPVLGLSQPTTVAVPVTVSMLSDDPAEQRRIADLIDAQMLEVYCPEASQATIAAIASYWQPVSPLSGRGSTLHTTGFDQYVRTLNTWAFDDPAHTAAAVRLYTGLAARFNLLQSRDPKSDRVSASAFGHYLSAGLRFDIPMRPAGGELLELSSFRNLRQAAADVGFGPIVDCPLKVAAVRSRASVATNAHFYMCDQGNGPVHAHRTRLAWRT